MANFNSFKITDAGVALEIRAQTGTPINFSKFIVGDGTYTGSVSSLTSLVHPVMTLPISRLKSQIGTNDKIIIGFDISSANVDTGFYLREIGIYATNPDGGNDILVFYGNSGNTADYIEPSSSATLTEKIIDIEMYISNASSITATIDSSLVYATQSSVNELSQAVSGKAPTSHASSSTTYGLGTTSNYGHVKTINNLTRSSYANGEALSAYQGYLLNQNKQDNLSQGNGILINNNQVAVNFGTAANTVCQGNDSRLSNARTPTAHASTNTTYGVGSNTEYGHVKVINNLDRSINYGGEALSAYQGYQLKLNKAPTNHASAETIYGLGTSTEYGHCKVIDNLSTTTISDGVALSAYQGYILNQKFANYLPVAGGTVTGLITASGGIKGELTGDVTGNCSGSSGSCTGNAATATKLAVARSINGTNFSGTGNITTAKWGTARTLALSGAVSGSASVDGSGNVTIETAQNNIAIFTGSFRITEGSQAGNAFITYPSGFNSNNCVVLAFGVDRSGEGPYYDYASIGTFTKSIWLSTYGAQATVYKTSGSFTGSESIDYKIVLMKVS